MDLVSVDVKLDKAIMLKQIEQKLIENKKYRYIMADNEQANTIEIIYNLLINNIMPDNPESNPAIMYCISFHHNLKQDCDAQVKWLQMAADKAYAPAQSILADIYVNANNVKKYEKFKNIAKGVELYILSAHQGIAHSQRSLGELYYNGTNIVKNYLRAIEWFTEAINHGCTDSYFDLGFMYYCGNGVEQNYVTAAMYYKKGADFGNRFAQNKLAKMYASGTGIPVDIDNMVKYYTLAAHQGCNMSQYSLGEYYEKVGDRRNAIKYFILSSNNKNSSAQHKLDALLNNTNKTADLIHELLIEIDDMKNKLEKQSKLIEHIELFPGKNVEEAKKHFESMFANGLI